MLVYGKTTDGVDEYVWMAESTCIEAMIGFSTGVVMVFGKYCLRKPRECLVQYQFLALPKVGKPILGNTQIWQKLTIALEIGER